MRPIDADALLETLKHWYTHAKQDMSGVEGKVALHYGALRFTEEIVKHMPVLTLDDLLAVRRWEAANESPDSL